ncbi:hypothetical protein [Acuticoccus mangrovi]|uniref:hypothetical protein n=1 Tax=Acuticoccus mangrovi TaxID=2796142 RepID=UPI0018EA22C3
MKLTPAIGSAALRGPTDADAEPGVEERFECGGDRGVADDDGEDRRGEETDAGGRPPADEVDGGGVHAMAEPAQHRIDERARVPGPAVAPAEMKKVGVDPRPRSTGS